MSDALETCQNLLGDSYLEHFAEALSKAETWQKAEASLFALRSELRASLYLLTWTGLTLEALCTTSWMKLRLTHSFCPWLHSIVITRLEVAVHIKAVRIALTTSSKSPHRVVHIERISTVQ